VRACDGGRLKCTGRRGLDRRRAQRVEAQGDAASAAPGALRCNETTWLPTSSVSTVTVEEERFCTACGHSLAHAAKGACPECGRWFDGNDPESYRTEPIGRAEGFLRAVGRQRWALK